MKAITRHCAYDRHIAETFIFLPCTHFESFLFFGLGWLVWLGFCLFVSVVVFFSSVLIFGGLFLFVFFYFLILFIWFGFGFFPLLDCISFTGSPSLALTQSWFPFPTKWTLLAHECWAESHVNSCYTTAHGNHPSRSLHASSTHLHPPPRPPESSAPSRIFPPDKVFIPILVWPLLSQSPDSLCAGAQHLISPLTCHPVSCLFIKRVVQDMPYISNAGVFKTCP